MSKLLIASILLLMIGCGLINEPPSGYYLDNDPLKKDTLKVLYNKNNYTVYIKNGDTNSTVTNIFNIWYHKIKKP